MTKQQIIQMQQQQIRDENLLIIDSINKLRGGNLEAVAALRHDFGELYKGNIQSVEKRIGKRIRDDTLSVQLAAVLEYYMAQSVDMAAATSGRLFCDIYNYGAVRGTTARLFGIKGQTVKDGRSMADTKEYMDACKRAGDYYVKQFTEDVKKAEIEQVQAEEMATKSMSKIGNVERVRAVTTCTKAAENVQKSCLESANKKPERFLFVAVLDSRTTEGCRQKHGTVYNRSEYAEGVTVPPCHWCCRSSIVWVPDDEIV